MQHFIQVAERSLPLMALLAGAEQRAEGDHVRLHALLWQARTPGLGLLHVATLGTRIIHGGETNYIRATVSLYLNIYNIFVHLLSLLGVLGSDD